MDCRSGLGDKEKARKPFLETKWPDAKLWSKQFALGALSLPPLLSPAWVSQPPAPYSTLALSKLLFQSAINC